MKLEKATHNGNSSVTVKLDRLRRSFLRSGSNKQANQGEKNSKNFVLIRGGHWLAKKKTTRNLGQIAASRVKLRNKNNSIHPSSFGRGLLNCQSVAHGYCELRNCFAAIFPLSSGEGVLTVCPKNRFNKFLSGLSRKSLNARRPGCQISRLRVPLSIKIRWRRLSISLSLSRDWQLLSFAKTKQNCTTKSRAKNLERPPRDGCMQKSPPWYRYLANPGARVLFWLLLLLLLGPKVPPGATSRLRAWHLRGNACAFRNLICSLWELAGFWSKVFSTTCSSAPKLSLFLPISDGHFGPKA